MAHEADKKLYVSEEVVQALFEMVLKEFKDLLPVVSEVVPVSASEISDQELQKKLPTVLAVYNALQSIDHTEMRFVTGTEGQSLEDALGETSPEELVFYLYRVEGKENYDMYVYDSTKAKYVQIGIDSTMFGPDGVFNPEEYWKKGDLDIELYWKKSDLNIDDYLKSADADEKFALKSALEEYVKKDEFEELTTEDVQRLFEAAKAKVDAE